MLMFPISTSTSVCIDCLGFDTFDDCNIDTEPDTTETICSEDCVWPGDVNQDGIANHFDILGLGMAFGQTGPTRTDASSLWMPQHADDWANYILDGTNSKHADCDGNGLVDNEDVAVISQNYAAINSTWDIETDNSSSIPLYLDEPEDGYQVGSIDIPVLLGTPANEVTGFYGIAFSIS